MLFGKKKQQTEEQEQPQYEYGNIDVRDIIAPAAIEVTPNYIKLGRTFARTFFVYSYPRYLYPNWLSPVINMPSSMDVTLFIYPADSATILKNLRRKVTEVQAELMEREEKGLIRDPQLETAFQDLEALRDKLMTAQERMFEVGLYITLYGESLEELEKTETELRSILEGKLVYIRSASFQQKEGFAASAPALRDALNVNTPLNTEPLSSFFPFVSFDLTSNEGILYGINRHNNSLILFDRFSLENANEVVFAKSGSGKSVRGHEKVLVESEGRVRLLPIQEIVDEEIKKRGITYRDDELEGVAFPNLKVWSFDSSLKGSWSRVTVAARKKAPSRFYRFTTSSGRTIETTPDHNIVLLKNGVVEVAQSANVKEGDAIPLPRSIKENGGVSGRNDALDVFGALSQSRRLYIRGAQEFIRDRYAAFCATYASHPLGKYMYKYRNGARVPISFFSDMIKGLTAAEKEDVLSRVEIISKNGSGSLPARLPVTEELMRLLGYVVSEGTITRKEVIASNTEEEVVRDIVRCAQRLGLSWFAVPRAIIIPSVVFAELLIKLGCGKRSETKGVPQFVFSQPDTMIKEFVAAYFEGDGGVEHSSVSAVSKSKELISGISYLLYRFGVVARIAEIKKRAPGWTASKPYFRCVISGKSNIARFHASVGFISSRKKRLLETLAKRNAVENTNIDTIPGLAPIFQEIDRLFGFQLHGIANISPLKRGVFNPSPALLKELVRKIEERIVDFENRASHYKILSELPSLAAIIEEGKSNREINNKLWKTLGQSWRTVKNEGAPPFSKNALAMIEGVGGPLYSLPDIKQRLFEGFREMDLSVKHFDRSLQAALVDRPHSNTSYEKIYSAACYIWENYSRVLEYTIPRVRELLARLETLADSDLLWDPIKKIEVFENTSDEYVYDLTVDNEVFLAGTGGMFVHNSYAVKLEILRYLMQGVDVIVIDPENEYQTLAETVGGSFFKISLTSPHHINPFDLPPIGEDEHPSDVLRSNIINLVGLLRIMLGGLTPEEDAIIDRALQETYAARDITPDVDFSNATPPLLSDFKAILEGMEGAESLVKRLEKYTEGTYAGFMNQYTNVNMQNNLVVFAIRDMEEALRPIAMFIILRYIWNAVRHERKKRIAVVDEAWWMMQYEDGASFLYGLAKRGRKYWLGLTTITQDVADFMKSTYGQPIVANSSMQLLLRQSPATIDIVKKTFVLTEEEKYLLLESQIGEGLFFAGQKHVAIKIVASYVEDQIITTSPEQLEAIKEQKAAETQ